MDIWDILSDIWILFDFPNFFYRFKSEEISQKVINKKVFIRYLLTSIFQFSCWIIIWSVFAYYWRYNRDVIDKYGDVFLGCTILILTFYEFKVIFFMNAVYQLKKQLGIINKKQGILFMFFCWLPLFNFVLGIVFYQWKNQILVAQGYNFVYLKKLK